MGYYTTYRLQCSPVKNVDIAESIQNWLTEHGVIGYALDEFSDYYNHSLIISDHEPVKWYEFNDDMIELSEAFPEVTFKLHGEGEESGDIWDRYYLNGDVEDCEWAPPVPKRIKWPPNDVTD